MVALHAWGASASADSWPRSAMFHMSSTGRGSEASVTNSVARTARLRSERSTPRIACAHATQKSGESSVSEDSTGIDGKRLAFQSLDMPRADTPAGAKRVGALSRRSQDAQRGSRSRSDDGSEFGSGAEQAAGRGHLEVLQGLFALVQQSSADQCHAARIQPDLTAHQHHLAFSLVRPHRLGLPQPTPRGFSSLSPCRLRGSLIGVRKKGRRQRHIEGSGFRV